MKRLLRAAALSSLMLVPATTLMAAGAPPESAAVAEAIRTRTAEDPKLVWTASNVVLVAQELAPGVFAVYPDDSTRIRTTPDGAARPRSFVRTDLAHRSTAPAARPLRSLPCTANRRKGNYAILPRSQRAHSAPESRRP